MHSITEAELRKDRERILKAIKSLEGELAENDVVLRVFERIKNAENVAENDAPDSEAGGQAPSGTKPRGAREKKTSSPPLRMAQVIRGVINDQKGEFTTVSLTQRIREKNPELAGRLPQSYISTLLWRMTNSKQVVLVSKGANGKSNIYALNLKK